MINLSEMREKEVINIKDGAKMGYIYDFELDLENGRVVGIIIPGPGKVLGLFGKNKDLMIEWKNIVRIGTDAILVDIGTEE
ncbi:YlmC/YmxH family sporulation protein [Tepidimicrobium xylanilyticum]|uniref:Sporulation protein, YlmC/YmxH family n=1 Tax=Tepidimicrobium xylanilyticum TaxID=1123352 RepID=A0A1H2SP46_9FIRM|nr:YlmC/YmxH family sporulation protein [Tepidimicrobium xylanilyticum]GMG96159.1 YlmC/YmxH family sporulation protein [Tepidimicrobium xylanilyticum]SDW33372.1 sporulation protein, YlmC/YmxH family [Tepidimicrobium xylanilyticum]